jgi:crossover junction endodeoxyribonuclease RuvC
MTILGIDPGYERIGIAIIERLPSKKDRLVYSNCFKTKASLPFPIRLKNIGQELEKVITEYNPRALAIEKLYFTSNQKTVMGVSEARGVIIYTASKNNLEVFEYTPLQIKVAVTGYGRASKEMVATMVPKLIEVRSEIKSDDEVDAVAIALTCLACEKFSTVW